MTERKSIFETNMPDLKLLSRGKVRDMYDVGDEESLLMVASDRISAFDRVLNDPIPEKGVLLNQATLFWLNYLKGVVSNHLITPYVNEYPKICHQYEDQLVGRSMLVHKAKPLPIECVVRGYITGSGWKSYKESGMVCGIQLPAGLKESDKLPEPIFTPSTKELMGMHDVNIDFDEAARLIGYDLAEKVKQLSLNLYKEGESWAAEKGIIIADTKFEFGIRNDQVILIDEVLTPDSSRFWPRATYKPGGPQESFDKQYLRDYLLSIGWKGESEPPKLPALVIENTRAKYIEAFERLTGQNLRD
ncbi:MAG: phosphoribosylaminoimidazolesuccinocarboxamide synthase [Candidatus Moraniibacteriota bacterium]